MKQTLTIALSKGRIFKDTLPLLAKADIIPQDDPVTSRKLILDTNHEDVKLVVIRATDVPTYVRLGAADMGVAGKDVLMEQGSEDLYEPLDLEIARCKMMVATLKDAAPVNGRLRVATKYVNCARDYYAGLSRQVDIIKLYGAMELAPIVDLADCIVDLVETGGTLKANGLVATEHMHDISSRLVVNPGSYKMKHERIKSLLDTLRRAVEERRPAAAA